MGRPVKLMLSIKKRSDDKPVHFKVDGGRFQAEKTLKLNVNTDYIINLTFKPDLDLHGLTIQGEKVEVSEGKKDESQAVYEGSWTSTGLGLDKSGKRHQLSLLLEMDTGLTAKLTLQCKFYAQNETSHSHWGSELGYIDYECNVPDGATYLDILKETFR